MSEDLPPVTGAMCPTAAIEVAAYVRVDWARVDLPLRFVSFVERPLGIWLHWHHGGNKLCRRSVSEGEVCPHCVPEVKAARWYACLLGNCLRSCDDVIALLPEKSYHRATKEIIGVNLAGKIITLTRPHAYSTVTVAVSRQRTAITRPLISAEQFAAIVEHCYLRMETNMKKGKADD